MKMNNNVTSICLCNSRIKIMIKKTISAFFFILLSLTVFCQNQTVIGEVISTGVGFDSDLTKARNKAINDAKINALRKVGIEENISSYSDLYRSEADENYQELFSSQVFTEIRGAVRSVKILNEKKKIIEGDNIKFEIEISCEVLRYNTITDNMFKAEISGVKPFYYEKDLLSFTINSTKEAYLYVFCIPQNQNEAYFIFPNEYEEQFLLEPNYDYKFPEKVDFYLFLDGKAQQTDRVIFVLTKEKFPYVGDINYKNLIDWIFSIPPDQRFVNSFSYSISKK